jgi:integrase
MPSLEIRTMPNSFSSIPKYRKHKASGQAVVTLRGHDHYLGPYGTKVSKLEYDRLVGEWMAAGRPTKSAAPGIAVATIVLAFWRQAKSLYRKKGRDTGTLANYRPVLKLLRARYGRTLAADFGPLALKALRHTLIDAGNSRRYVNENIHRIRRVFKWAASEQLIPLSVHQALATVEGLRTGQSAARESVPVKPVSNQVVEATLPYLSPVVADMVRLQRLTGARPGEICTLRPIDLDRSSEIWKFMPAEHKTEHHGHSRVIFIGPRAQQVLLPYLLRPADAYCFSPAESEQHRRQVRHRQRSTPLRQGNRPGSNKKQQPQRSAGEAYSNDSYRRAVGRACELAFKMPVGLRRIARNLPAEEKRVLRERAAQWRNTFLWTPHQLRHSAATEIRNKFGLEATQATLGHSHMKVTEIYAAKNLELAAMVAREVG